MADSRIINVGGDRIGLRGLDETLEAMAPAFADRSDKEVAAEMLDRLGERNYLAPSALDEYAAAFVREFRKHQGQDYESDGPGGLEVKILGPGCPQCDQLYQRVAKVLSAMGLAADLEAVKDAKAIAASGVSVTPGLMVNGKVVSVGKMPGEGQIKHWLKKSQRTT